MNVLSHKLALENTGQLPPSQVVLEAVRSAKLSLTVAIASVKGSSSSPLPQQEKVVPNQHSWTEMAEHMGAQKWHRRRLPEEIGLTEKAIGAAKGKHRQLYTDPYAGGKRPGRLAKTDAVLATANQKVRACTLPPASQPTPTCMPPPNFASLPASQPILGPAFVQSLPLSQALATQAAHNYAFSPAPTYAFPPAGVL